MGQFMKGLVKEHLRAHRFAEAQSSALTTLDGLQSWKPPKIDYSKRLHRPISRNLYIPIELAARDLPHRARLAADAAYEGFHVVFGATWNLSAHGYRDLPPGIVLLKSLDAAGARHAIMANNAGHQVAAMPEDLVSLVSHRDIYDVEINKAAMEMVDLVMLHSDAATSIVRDLYSGVTAKIVTAGNPRMDGRDVRTGDEIVICTKAGIINGWMSVGEGLAGIGYSLGKKFIDVMYRRIRDQVKHEFEALPLVLDTIDALKLVYGDRVVVRPHPDEDPLTFGFARDPVPFAERLRSAACVVFVSGCDTGLEAALHGVPAVRLGHGGDGISRSLGISAESPQAAVIMVDRALAGMKIEPPEGIVKRPNNVLQELSMLFHTNSLGHGTDPVQAIAAARPAQFSPTPFQKHRFPDQSSSAIERYCGRAPRTIGWNLWALSP